MTQPEKSAPPKSEEVSDSYSGHTFEQQNGKRTIAIARKEARSTD